VPPWRRGGAPSGAALDLDFFRRPVVEVARALLGTRLASSLDGVVTTGVIVETEAYQGPSDPASHAATAAGRTHRNRAMFGPPGHAYVYRIYGMHWCVNVVTGAEGDPQAVLVRGLEPLEGIAEMERRRGGRTPLTAGPGRLCEALGITGALYGHHLLAPPLRILPGWQVPDRQVVVTGRIGVRAAAERPFRFYVRGSPGVTPGR
jgi:DNA-3-methyladenine glycosylase